MQATKPYVHLFTQNNMNLLILTLFALICVFSTYYFILAIKHNDISIAALFAFITLLFTLLFIKYLQI